MPDTFDPYLEWLGVDGAGQTPDHYHLLSLNPSETDADVIARAADTAMARVRRVRPGAHLAEWSRLLDYLTATKACLLDPTSRAAYDDSLRNPAPAVSAPSVWSSPAAAPPPSYFNAPPPNMETTQFSSSQTAVEERPRSPFPVGYSEPPVYAEASAGASPPPAPMEFVPEAPMPAEAEAIDFSPLDTAPSPVAVAAKPAEAATSSTMRLILVGVALLAIAVAAIMGARSYRQGQLTAKSEVVAPSEPEPMEPLAAVTPKKPPKKTPNQDAAKQEAEKLKAEKAKAAELEAKKAQEDAEKAEAEKKKAEAEKTEADQKKEEAEKQKAENEKNKPPVDPKKAEAFAEAIANVKAALADRDMEAAGNYIKTVSANVQSPEDQEQLDRIGTMHENLKQFWKGIRGSMAKLQAAEELVLNKDNRIVVVESGPDMLTIKAEGRLQRFKATTLPTPVVMLLVEQYFGKDPGSKAVIATFLAVDPNGDRALAQRYWQEAAKAGIDSQKLLQELGGNAAKPADHVDPLMKKITALEESMRTARGMSSFREIAQNALKLAEDAVGEQRMDEAAKLSALAVEAAKKSKNTPLMRQAATINQQILAIKKQQGGKK